MAKHKVLLKSENIHKPVEQSNDRRRCSLFDFSGTIFAFALKCEPWPVR